MKVAVSIAVFLVAVRLSRHAKNPELRLYRVPGGGS
jgi:hypothetical protein